MTVVSVLETLRSAARAASSMLLTRAEFAALELTQTGAGALRWLMAALVATALLMLTLAVLTATIALALWERLGWYSLAFLTLIFGGLTAFVIYRLLQALRSCPPVLEQTLAELAKDREALFGHRPDADPERRT